MCLKWPSLRKQRIIRTIVAITQYAMVYDGIQWKLNHYTDHHTVLYYPHPLIYIIYLRITYIHIVIFQ